MGAGRCRVESQAIPVAQLRDAIWKGSENSMDAPMNIGRKIIRLLKQAWQLPRTASITARRQRNEREVAEAERLDRIRNPSKYRGR